MAAQEIRSFRIRQYLVDPSKRLISGPTGVCEMSSAEMGLLLELAHAPRQFVNSRKLLATAGKSAAVDSTELPNLISNLSAALGERSNHAELIVGSIDKGFMLCANIAWDGHKGLPSSNGQPAHQDPEFDDFVQQLSNGTSPDAIDSPENHPWTPPASETGWFAALKQRRVFRATGAYAVSSWLIMQITALLVGAFPAIPPSATGTVTIALAIGFPIVVLLAWLLQVTPAGIVVDLEPENRDGFVKERLVHLIDVFVIGALLVIVAILGFDRYASNKIEEVSVAVLAFTNSNELEDDRYLGVGIADNIRTRLTSADKLLVAAPPSRELQPSQDMTVKSIGERMAVDNVLYGSVRRADDRVRLDVHLVDVSTGFSQWGKSYDVPLEDMLRVNSDISLYVASELEVILTRELRQSLAGNPTDIPSAYEAYLEARKYMELPRTDSNLGKALLFFNEAIEADPSFALAYAGRCEAFTATYVDSADLRAVDLAEMDCDQALSLDDGLSQVHVALGNLYDVSGRLDDAEASFTSALDLDQESLDAIIGLGNIYAARGEFLQAERHYLTAIDKLPNNWNGYNQLARFLLSRGRYQDAAENYRHVLAFMPDNVNAYNNLGAAYYFMGDFSQAAENYRRSLQLEPDEANYSNTGSMYYYDGDFVNAAAMYKKAVELSPKDYRVWGNLADALRFITKSFDECQIAYRKAIQLAESQLAISGNDIEIKSSLAHYLVNTGNRTKSERLLEQIGLTLNLNPEYQYRVALIYKLLGANQRSEQALSQAKIQGYSESVINATPEFNNPELMEPYLRKIIKLGATNE